MWSTQSKALVQSMKEKQMFLLELSCFYDPTYVGNLLSGSSAFSKSSLNNWKFMVHVLLKPGLENLVYNSCLCEYLTCPQIQYIQNFLSFPPLLLRVQQTVFNQLSRHLDYWGLFPLPPQSPSIQFHFINNSWNLFNSISHFSTLASFIISCLLTHFLPQALFSSND